MKFVVFCHTSSEDLSKILAPLAISKRRITEFLEGFFLGVWKKKIISQYLACKKISEFTSRKVEFLFENPGRMENIRSRSFPMLFLVGFYFIFHHYIMIKRLIPKLKMMIIFEFETDLITIIFFQIFYFTHFLFSKNRDF